MTGVAPTTNNFTAEQQRILGDVYRLILRWRLERRAVPANHLSQDGLAISELPARQVVFRSAEED